MSLDASAFKKKQNLMFFFRPSQQKSSFRHSETTIFLLESWPCHAKFMCMNIRAFQKSHKYHVSGCKTKNYPKKNRGTRKGAVSAGYQVFGHPKHRHVDLIRPGTWHLDLKHPVLGDRPKVTVTGGWMGDAAQVCSTGLVYLPT